MPWDNGLSAFKKWLFSFMDSCIILMGIILGGILRFKGMSAHFFNIDYLVFKSVLILLVIQVSFYYFDLYDFKILRKIKKIGLLILGSLGASSVILGVIYYLVPDLAIGRGILAIGLFLILLFTFLWRIVYSHIIKTWIPKERLLIIGTGQLARKINHEIIENGYEDFEIVGFVDENADKIENRI